jgi:hypothetical protein
MVFVMVACLAFILGYVWHVAGNLGSSWRQAPSPDGVTVDSVEGAALPERQAVLAELRHLSAATSNISAGRSHLPSSKAA